MTILKSDIKLMASQRLSDYYDGGGAMTGNEVVSGELNNLFPDISRLDRVYGRVSLRKCFPAVMTNNSDMYYGAHAIITDPPDDDNVYVTMFSTGDFDDIRDDAKDRIESYVGMAQELLVRPMNDQLAGQRTINCFQKINSTYPEIGKTIVLTNVVNGDTQYVRITGVSVVRESFVHSVYGVFEVDLVTLDISAPLNYTFPGIEVTPYTTKANTRIHATVVTDASRYYGVSKVVQAIAQGARTFRVDSIYNQLVPTSQIESALVDQLMGGDTVTYYPKGPAGSMSFTGTRSDAANAIHLPDGVMPGSLDITILGYAFKDLRGALVPVVTDGGFSGVVDYASGQISIQGASWSGEVSLTATPAVAIPESYTTMEIQVELANRSYTYTPNLSNPTPQPGSVYIDYMAQGKWYRLYDDGRGVLTSDLENVGTGTVDYVSGSLIVTLGALPDVGTSIIFSWGSGAAVTDRSGGVPYLKPVLYKELSFSGVEPGSVTITWMDGSLRTATDDGESNLTGDATGYVSYGAGKVWIQPDTIPPSGTEYTIAYQQETANSITEMDPVLDDNLVEYTIPGAPLRPGSVAITWQAKQIQEVRPGGATTPVYVTHHLIDDCNGNLRVDLGGEIAGTVNYTTGAVSFIAIGPYQRRNYYWALVNINPGGTTARFFMVYYLTNHTEELYGGVTYDYSPDTPPMLADKQDTIAAPVLTLDLNPYSADRIVANSVVFNFGGHRFYDVAGKIYRNRDAATGVGTYSGTIDYANGKATLDVYPSMAMGDIDIDCLLSSNASYLQPGYVFRTPGAPVRDGSFSCRANLEDGTLITATAGTDGVIQDDMILGAIDTQNGVVRLAFGEMVTAAGNEEEPWYDASLVVEGMIWKPGGVAPETALYNTVLYSTLPLEADLVGIEPVRLPTDGRVPIFRPGDVVVLHHTASEPVGSSFVQDQVIQLSRTNLSIVDLIDYQGNLVLESYYTVDLPLGRITVTNPAGMNALTDGGTQNIVAAHRIEDMLLISEAQINGYLSSVGPVTHTYPATGAQCSSALIFGDLCSRIIRWFTQKTWDGIYRDVRSGDDSTAKYDNLNYPVVMTNDGGVDQRWVIKFTSGQTVDVVGEQLGVILSGASILADIAPINPATNKPYFRIVAAGWGSGWVSGNNVRFDTSAANYPMWLARTTMQGEVTEPTDNFMLQIRGDAN